MKSNRFIFLLTLILCLSLSLAGSAQTLKSYQKAAEKSLAEKNYHAALTYYREALGIAPDEVSLQYGYAQAARNFSAFDLAAEYYEKVMQSKEREKFPQASYYAALVKKQRGDYVRAVDYFNKYLTVKSLGKDKNLTERAKIEIENCRAAARAVPDPLTEITHFDKKINTPYSEFAPYLQDDLLYYSSFRFLDKDDKHDPPRRYTKLLTAKSGSKGRTLRGNVNVAEKHTAHTAFSLDGKRMYFTICDFTETDGIRCKLYYREKNRRGNRYLKAIALPEFMNSDKYTSTQPTVGYDSLRKKEIIIFSSDRPGGKGGNDLWLSEITDGKFGKPENLTELNTAADDLTPYWETASQTLFFSTDGRFTFGGYDIYASKKEKAGWQKPENLGLPINSSYNDLYYFFNSNTQKGYLSSNRLGSMYLDRNNKTCCNDIYAVAISPATPPTDSLPPPQITEIPPVDTLPATPPDPKSLADFEPFALYFDNDEPDKRTRRTTTKKDYATTYESYRRRQAEYREKYAAPLPEEDHYAAEELIDDFFNNEVEKGYRYLFIFSDLLLQRLQKGDEVDIIVKGFTSPRAQSDYNEALGKRRISSVRNHFATYSNGIFLPYIRSGSLEISEQSYGESTAQKGVSDDLEDLRNSVYSIGAARERRVEILEIAVKGLD